MKPWSLLPFLWACSIVLSLSSKVEAWRPTFLLEGRRRLLAGNPNKLEIVSRQLSVWDNGGQYDVTVSNMLQGRLLKNAQLRIESRCTITQIWGAERVRICRPDVDKFGRGATCVIVAMPQSRQYMGSRTETGEAWRFSFALVAMRTYSDYLSAITASVGSFKTNFTAAPAVSTSTFFDTKLKLVQTPGPPSTDTNGMLVVHWRVVAVMEVGSPAPPGLLVSMPCARQGGLESMKNLNVGRIQKVQGRDICTIKLEQVEKVAEWTYFLFEYDSVGEPPQPILPTHVILGDGLTLPAR